MNQLQFALDQSSYTWTNALLWGNFVGHCKKAETGHFGNRIVHGLIAATELLPIIGQLASICEKIIATKIYQTTANKIIDAKVLPKVVVPDETTPLPTEESLSAEVIAPTEVIFPTALKEPELSEAASAHFASVNSSITTPIGAIKDRKGFLNQVNGWQEKPVIISKSEFVSDEMAEHLMRNKKDAAIAVKYRSGDIITNMEGAMHTFLTPICPITMTGDYSYNKKHTCLPLQSSQKIPRGRNVILSAAIHPDFECAGTSEVVMKLVEMRQTAVQGAPLTKDFIPLAAKCTDPETKEVNKNAFKKNLPAYETQLQKHLIYHLTKTGRLPSKQEVGKPMTIPEALQAIENLIESDEQDVDLQSKLENAAVSVNGHTLSLEALFNLYVHQIRNEFSVLEATLTQGYVYTIDPPAIFAKQLGKNSVPLLNRLQLLALKHLSQESEFNHLKVIGINDYSDQGIVDLYKTVFPDKNVLPKSELFTNQGHYSLQEEYALVLHNNSDAFGQNIETEGPTSMDGVIGSYSDAACHLKRTREDLMAYVV